jgi:hypothetical protein
MTKVAGRLSLINLLLIHFNYQIDEIMKLYSILLVIIGMTVASTGYAQKEVVEDTLTVKGVCGMCKERIEEAAYGKGVKYATWDKATDQLAIAYRTDKTQLEEIEARLLTAGHEVNGKVPAKESYEALPKCCRYEELEKH